MGCSKNKFAALTLTALTLSCSGNSFDIPPEFPRLYGDLRIASREFGELSPDGRIARTQILERYGYTAQKFDSIAERLQGDADSWNVFQESVSAYIDSIAVAFGAISPQKNVKDKK